MKFTAMQVMKKLAAERFSLGKTPEFAGFDKIEVSEEATSTEELEDLDAHIEVWAKIRLPYDGVPPESYRVLNQMIMDWVDSNEAGLKKIINSKLLPWLKEQYKEADVSDLNESLDDYIWEDQVDYMPDVDESKKTISFTLELVLDVEEDDSED